MPRQKHYEFVAIFLRAAIKEYGEGFVTKLKAPAGPEFLRTCWEMGPGDMPSDGLTCETVTGGALITMPPPEAMTESYFVFIPDQEGPMMCCEKTMLPGETGERAFVCGWSGDSHYNTGIIISEPTKEKFLSVLQPPANEDLN